MARIKCRIIYNTLLDHLSQIYTGFTMLRKAGIIDLTQQHDNRYGASNMLVIVNDKIRILYDTHDSCNLVTDAVTNSDYYFKRSYSTSDIPQIHRNKVFPLGLNYELYDHFDFTRLQGILGSRSTALSKLKWIVRSIPGFENLYFTPTPRNMHSPPDHSGSPRILFSVRAWDPETAAAIQKDKITELNEKRVNCIQLLRKEFGNSFFGGVEHSEYAIKNFRHALLPDNELSRKGNYIKKLKGYPICVATTGLHGSIGWKFAEYVAFSKAIISEKLNFSVPGKFSSGKNYLEFESPEQCVEQAVKLFTDAGLRYEIRENNHQYYSSYLRPDALVLRTLEIALSASGVN